MAAALKGAARDERCGMHRRAAGWNALLVHAVSGGPARCPKGGSSGGINVRGGHYRRAKPRRPKPSEHFRAIVETTPECVKLVAPDGTLLHMNSSGLAMVGAPSAEAVTGKSVYDLIAPEDRDKFREFNAADLRGRKGFA